MLSRYEAVRGALQREQQLNVISNNLANIGTTGFKKDIMTFDEVLKEKTSVDLTSGSLSHTGNELDIALEQDGFFEVETARGVRYTRNGNFALDAEGNLVTGGGDKVLGRGGPVRIQGTEITVAASGDIIVDGELVDRLSVVDFTNRSFLKKQGNSLYVYDDPKQEGGIVEPDSISLKQGYIETSNVNAVEEMIGMMEALRTFESFTKVIQTYNEADSKLISEVGKL